VKPSDLQRELHAIRVQHAALRHAIERLAIGVALFDDGAVIPLNAAAKELLPAKAEVFLTESDGVKVRRTTIEGIAGAALEAEGPIVAMVHNGHGERRLHLFGVAQEGASAAALFMCDPLRKVAIPAEALHSLYALTNAEARLASELTNGCSMEEAAQNLGITANTARSHLKKIFAKTHTKRQGELVRLMAGTFALLAAD
jgi:DNA-binding CsgD family transcriptional regulator